MISVGAAAVKLTVFSVFLTVAGHRFSALGAFQHAVESALGDEVDLLVPLFKHTLYCFKVLFADDRLMHILDDHQLIRRAFDSLFQLEGNGRSFVPDHSSGVGGIVQHFADGLLMPDIFFCRKRSAFKTDLCVVIGGTQHLFVLQHCSNRSAAVAL